MLQIAIKMNTIKSMAPKIQLLLFRFFAMTYDALLLLGIWILSLALITILNGGEAVTHPLVMIFLLIEWMIYCIYFWIKGSYTPGMFAWRLRVYNAQTTSHSQPITLRQAFFRFFTSILSNLLFGAGLCFLLFDPYHRTLYDLISQTQVYRIPKQD